MQRAGLLRRGPEVAVVDQPRLVEVVRTDGVASLAGVLDAALPRAFVTAESKQATDGGANPRFGSIFDAPAPADLVAGDVQSCAIVSERADLTAALTAALEARSIACHTVAPARDFVGAGSALRAATTVEGSGPLDAVVVALAGNAGGSAGRAAPPVRRLRRSGKPSWPTTTGSSRTSWPTPPGREPPQTMRPSRNVRYGSSRSPTLRRPVAEAAPQASAQIARAAAGGTGRRVTALATSLESSEAVADERSGQLVAHLVAHPEAGALAGAELVVGPGWLGLRAHPRPIGTVVYGGPEIPGWLDGVLTRDRRCPRCRPGRAAGGRMTDTRQKPTRVVDAHVHLWDPARTDWYPYLSQPGQLGQEGIKREGASGMFRRFDADTYRAESARWNVEKFVNVAAATGPTPSTRPWS